MITVYASKEKGFDLTQSSSKNLAYPDLEGENKLSILGRRQTCMSTQDRDAGTLMMFCSLKILLTFGVWETKSFCQRNW